jgi:hypothetical protein
MKALPLPAVTRAMCALLALAAGAAARAEARGDPNGQQVSPPPPRQHMHRFAFPFFVVEPQVIVGREVVHDASPAAPAAPPVPAAPPPPRKPYVLGRSYDRLPGGCMKMIERGTSYFQCSGEWYRQVGGGSGGPYIAVERP